MEKEIKVSVVIPCYNYGHLVGRAIDSVRNQTVKAFEIIVVDDASTKYAKEVSACDADRIYKHIENQGGGASRNTGIKYAKGTHILLLDADDYLHPKYIEKTIGIDDIVSTNIEYTGSLRGKRAFKPNPKHTDFIQRNQIVNTTVFKREIWQRIGGFDEMLTGLEDWDFWLRATKEGYGVTVVQEYLSYYYRHSEPSRNHGSKKNYESLKRQIFCKL